jgi:hypothetical protein
MTADGYEPTSVDEAFARQGLPMPPIPEPLAGEIQQREQWLWSTRPDITAFAMYEFRDHLIESLTLPVSDYWAAGFAGHGVNSYSMNLFVVHGSIALFLQERWAGVYMDENHQRSLIESEFILISRLLDQAGARNNATLAPGKGRLVIAASGFRGNTWGWLDAPTGDPGAAQKWLSARAVPWSGGSDDAVATLRLASEWLASE